MKTKRPGNPNWGKATASSIPILPTSFEQVVKALGIAPHEYHESAQLKDWVAKNKNNKFVPVELLQTWGMTVKAEI
jgi:hypothetical protein